MTRAEALKIAKPIPFKTEMVQAILDGRKTVTRRIAKSLLGIGEREHGGEHEFILDNFAGKEIPTGFVCRKCGRGVSPPHSRCGVGNSWIVPPCFPGDILYVRETWQKCKYKRPEKAIPVGFKEYEYVYLADNEICNSDGSKFKWRPSIHMPKEAARIFLRVTGVRVERLRDITDEQAMREGVYKKPNSISSIFPDGDYKCECKPGQIFRSAQICFGCGIWDSTIKKSNLKKYGWEANPWVWVVEFEKLEVE